MTGGSAKAGDTSPVSVVQARIIRLGDGIGAQLCDVDLTRLSDDDLTGLRALLDDYKVLVACDQFLTVEDHLTLARRFGRLQLHPYLATLRSPHPHVLVMEGPRALARTWHSDETFLDDPPSVCILRMEARPEVGGDTTWSDLERAWETLPDELQRRLTTLDAIHVTLDGDRSVRHPVVRIHPRTGRPCLFVNRLYTKHLVGVADDESRMLLDQLFSHTEQAVFQCRFQWSVGSVAIWDNCCTQHRVLDDFATYRRVERVAVGGDRPRGFDGPPSGAW